jgi:3-hydroxyisobutyrate dehydrogenase-like beta-hydroxyacid dehydrogenase
MLTVGLVGIGQMGSPMARNLLKEGFPVVVYDIDKQKIRALTDFGAKGASNPKDLAVQSDVILTVLDYPSVVEAAIMGEGGILEGLRQQSILIECSSIDHETSIRLAGELRGKGRRFVEAAILGRPHIVESKQLVFLAAGEENAVKECYLIFNAIGRKVLYVGSFGAAKLLKIANAMVNATEIAVLCEVAAWSQRNQISREGLLEVLQNRSEESPSRVKQLAGIVGGRLQKQRTWMAKDVQFGLKVAGQKEIPMPLVSTVNTVINLAKSQNLEDYAFFEMMWKFYDQTVSNSDPLSS